MLQRLDGAHRALTQIRAHAMVQRYRSNRNTPMQAILDGFSLELGAVPTSASRWCALFDSVHVSTKNLDGHDAPCSPPSLQDGFTGRLHRTSRASIERRRLMPISRQISGTARPDSARLSASHDLGACKLRLFIRETPFAGIFYLPTRLSSGGSPCY